MPAKERKPSVTIRQADLRDARPICALIKSNPLELIVRPLGDIVRNIDRFTVVYAGGRLVGCASYSVLPEAGNFSHASIEMTSVAIRKSWRGMGLGRKLVETMVERISQLRPVPSWCAVDSVSADLDDDGWVEMIVCNNSENSLDKDPGHHVHHFGPNGFDPSRSSCSPTRPTFSARSASSASRSRTSCTRSTADA